MVAERGRQADTEFVTAVGQTSREAGQADRRLLRSNDQGEESEALTLPIRCKWAPKTQSSRQFNFNVMFLELKIDVKKSLMNKISKTKQREAVVSCTNLHYGAMGTSVSNLPKVTADGVFLCPGQM